MNNLAQCYFAAEGTGSIVPTDEDIAEGMKWLKIAAENGDMVSAKEFERRQNLTPTEAKVESMKDFFISTSGLGPKVNHLDEKQFRKEVEKAAKNGSIIAQRQLDIWVNLNIAMESFRNNDSARLFAALSKAIRLHHQLVEVPEIFKPIILVRFLL
uniref:Uncharacterized protein n=1 Tax=Panagrolaimus superbus TaxID=310955 RepID=A0A914Z897_9BILA